MAQVPTFEIKLLRPRDLTPSVRELTFERSDGREMHFEAGQWLNLVLPLPTGEIRRAYSIASPPGGREFSLAVTRVEAGPGSIYLHHLAPGERLMAVGPQGFFTRPVERSGPSLFIGTGTGVTPLRSMIQGALARGDRGQLWLLFGSRTEDDLLYRDEWEEMARSHPSFRAFFTLSRPSPTWTGRTGYVQEHVQELWSQLDALGEGTPHAYVCGLHTMVGAVRDQLRKDMGVAREQVHSERYD